jgi:hypothetical protein
MIHGPAMPLSALYPGYDEQSEGSALMVTSGKAKVDGRAARRVAIERVLKSILTDIEDELLSLKSA